MKKEYIEQLFKIAQKHSDAVVAATVDHLCNGLTQDESAEKHNVTQSSVGRAVSRIKQLDKLIVEAIIIKIS